LGAGMRDTGKLILFGWSINELLGEANAPESVR